MKGKTMKWLLDRLKEPSTHAAVCALITAAAALLPQYANYIVGVAGIFGFTAFVLPEQPKQ